MTLFQATDGRLDEVAPTTFAALGIKEREDIQRLLTKHIDVIARDTLIIGEEFGSWDKSRRRIDLLGINKDANLVVIELKRTEDGGHMELQALRYAAMVSTLTFDDAVETYEKYLATTDQDLDARTKLLEFLEWEEVDVEEFGKDVTIILASAEFSKEITSTVLWLNDRDLDIRCVRLRPYSDNGRVLIDVQQVIPLPEATDYQIKIRAKKVAERVARTQSHKSPKFDVAIGEKTVSNLSRSQAIYTVIRHLTDSGVDPDAIRKAIPWKTTMLVPIPGQLDSAAYQTALAVQLTENGRKPLVKRYLTDEDSLIHANGQTYAATKMWGPRTTQALDELLKAFPEHDISYSEIA